MTIVFFDTETGGLEDRHPTIQIAAVAVAEDWREVGCFEAKIMFQESDADPEALAMNSYNRDEWERNAKPEHDVLNRLCAFLSNHASVKKISKAKNVYRVARLAGHNAARFDAPRLQASCKSRGMFLPADFHVMDTLQLVMWKLATSDNPPQSYKLSDLCMRFGIDIGGAHDALADCRMAIALAQKLQEA